MTLLNNPQVVKFLLDENVNRRLLSFLTRKGFDTTLVPKGLKNGDVIRLSKKEQRILVTHDTDFGNRSIYTSDKIYSIVIYRIHPPVFDKLMLSLEQFLKHADAVTGKCFLLEESTYSEISE